MAQNPVARPPLPSRADLDQMLRQAHVLFHQRDGALMNTTERVVSGRLLVYLDALVCADPRLAGYSIDLEYERAGIAMKSLNGTRAGTGDRFARKIVPDLILHQRDVNDGQSNLLAIEIKTKPRADFAHDRAKLAVLTQQAPWAECVERGNRKSLVAGAGPRPRGVDTVSLPPHVHRYRHEALLHVYGPGPGLHIEWIR